VGSALENWISGLLPYFFIFYKKPRTVTSAVFGLFGICRTFGWCEFKNSWNFFFAGQGRVPRSFPKIFSPNGLRRCILHSDSIF
jgi:hypothetical protein